VLDASASFDRDGVIISYQWTQVPNGAPAVTIHFPSAANADFDVPPLADNESFVFFLLVTDDDGATATDQLALTARPAPGISTSDVSGHTAALNAAAQFFTRLDSRPDSDVTIPVSSSDPSEGMPDRSSLVFTPDNWHLEQAVVVRGQNPEVPGGVQNYSIILGPAESTDAFYDGLDVADIPMKGIALEISPPANLTDLTAQNPAELRPRVTYSGHSALSFSLITAPFGMTIDLSSGQLAWTPSEIDEGQTFDVTVAVNDGTLFADTTFQVRVADSQPLQSSVSGSVLTVTDPTTDLTGLTITATGPPPGPRASGVRATATSNIEELQLETVPPESIPAIPAHITRLTDVFVVKTPFPSPVELRMPLTGLPEDIDLRDINLFAYTAADDIPGPIWSSVFVDIRFEGTRDAPIVVISLQGLSGMYFFGTKNLLFPTESSAEPAGSLSPPGRVRPGPLFRAASDVTCTPRTAPFSQDLNYREQDCTYDGRPDVSIFVRDFGTTDTATRWHGATIEELIDWLVSAQGGFDDLGLDYENDIMVVVEPMSNLGSVTTGSGEDRRTVHLTDANIKQAIIQGTAVHEYFHHAQSRSPIDGLDLLIDGGTESTWLIEGTARWFEDYLFDDLDTYVDKEGRGARILEAGLNARPDGGIKLPYQRFSFFKLLLSRCGAFERSFRALLNVDRATDASGISKLSAELPDASCDFGSHLGSERADSLTAAIVYYQYATLFENMMSLLDGNESDQAFAFDPTPHEFNQTWFNQIARWLGLTDDTVHQLNGLRSIPAAGAYSFYVRAISGVLPEGFVAELVVDSDRAVIVSVTSRDAQFAGDNTLGTYSHLWFSTADQSSYVYDNDGAIPRLFVTVANPSLDRAATATVQFRIREEQEVDTVITSPAAGTEVSNRVISVTGLVPEEVWDSVSKVVVDSNGIKSVTMMNGDGSFNADVVVAVGDNTLKAQAFSGNTPITNEAVVNVTGVEDLSGVRNALVASRVVFVLRWDTNGTDVDLYSSDKNGGTIWYSDRTEGPGNLDFDDLDGFGPEVISYRATGDAVYANGTFDVDVHYFADHGVADPTTNYALNVVLNETDGANRRFLHYESVAPLMVSNSRQNGPNGVGNSRFNDVLGIACSAQGVCSLAYYDSTKLSAEGGSGSGGAARGFAARKRREHRAYTGLAKCLDEYTTNVAKWGRPSWECDEDGSKRW